MLATLRLPSVANGGTTAVLAVVAACGAGAVQAAACSSTTVLYTAPAATGAADASNWANANTLQGALPVANGNHTAGQ